MLALSKLYPVLSYADNKGLFVELEELYQRLPETVCEKCATCCTVPPPGYLIEFLNLYKYVRDNLKDHHSQIMENVMKFFYLELVDINIKCPFLDNANHCLVYPVRPLGCRIFGLLSEKDFGLGSKRQLEAVARKFREQHGIELPREVVDFELKYCDQVRSPDGKKKNISITLLQELASGLERLEYKIMPQQVVEEMHTFAPVATHLALSVLPEGARMRRLRVMKEYLENGSSEMLDRYVERFSKFEF